jgi:hypothetical protein
MIEKIIDAIKTNIIYAALAGGLLTWFIYDNLNGSEFFHESGVQKNAGYRGPIPHSGFGVRFYHK